MPATDEDREYGWRHAFAYADRFVDTDQATAYANHYATLIRDEPDMRYWPGHAKLFHAWKYTQ